MLDYLEIGLGIVGVILTVLFVAIIAGLFVLGGVLWVLQGVNELLGGSGLI